MNNDTDPTSPLDLLWPRQVFARKILSLMLYGIRLSVTPNLPFLCTCSSQFFLFFSFSCSHFSNSFSHLPSSSLFFLFFLITELPCLLLSAFTLHKSKRLVSVSQCLDEGFRKGGQGMTSGLQGPVPHLLSKDKITNLRINLNSFHL